MNTHGLNSVKYSQFGVQGLLLDETNMLPMFVLRVYVVTMASENTSGNFSCRFEKSFITTLTPLLTPLLLRLNTRRQIELWWIWIFPFCSISMRFLVVISSDSNVGHLKTRQYHCKIFQNELATEMNVFDKQDFARNELKLSLGRIFYVETASKLRHNLK